MKVIFKRTCQGCEKKTTEENSYRQVLVPISGTIQESLNGEVFKEEEIERKCSCGSEVARETFEYLTPPNVLLVTVKRFEIGQPKNVEEEVYFLGKKFKLFALIQHTGTP